MNTMGPLLIVSLCLTSSLITADNGAVHITAVEDSDVVLPCSLSSMLNLEKVLFDWKKDAGTDEEKRVFMYDAGRYSGEDFEDQDKQFKGRVSFSKDELKNGNASIKITKTKVSDNGSYTCIFPHLQPSQTFSIQLVVDCILKDRTAERIQGACPRPTTRSREEQRDWSLLECKVLGASPKPVVEWRNSSGNIIPAKKPQVTERGGSYDIILQTTVTKSDTYSCVVTQNEICHQVKETTVVHISGPPSAGWALTPLRLLVLICCCCCFYYV